MTGLHARLPGHPFAMLMIPDDDLYRLLDIGHIIPSSIPTRISLEDDAMLHEGRLEHVKGRPFILQNCPQCS